ncbi:unnamed protein product [Pleuronectes platessa]|uniref:Uncharacterized protein n=1 Tax=Pleuronectes platessa TaxID=8262 RepID=A0A9N7VW07_PLEPL|nr:unnamed protein product [Pleuronectes platessa]
MEEEGAAEEDGVLIEECEADRVVKPEVHRRNAGVTQTISRPACRRRRAPGHRAGPQSRELRSASRRVAENGNERPGRGRQRWRDAQAEVGGREEGREREDRCQGVYRQDVRKHIKRHQHAAETEPVNTRSARPTCG